MGNLIKVLTRDIDNNGGNFFLDFENAQPSQSETAVWEEVNQTLTEARLVLDHLQAYRGAGEEIRQVRTCTAVHGASCTSREYFYYLDGYTSLKESDVCVTQEHLNPSVNESMNQ
uniref:CYFIP-related Rac1 interactor B-like n=1 Tax=Gasterosteus aculeatus aculeatus TaxID=481459 RepID=UPI001A996C66|nr:CYFIP-related Rac1 interactor B-like [Gasterosteus aculeatus aculeatus]